jgi:hypothetical protein
VCRCLYISAAKQSAPGVAHVFAAMLVGQLFVIASVTLSAVSLQDMGVHSASY